MRLFFPREGQTALRMPTVSNEAWIAQLMLVPRSVRPWVRNLTIRRARPANDEIDIGFALHGDSPMTSWVRRAEPGEPAGIFDIGTVYRLPAAGCRSTRRGSCWSATRPRCPLPAGHDAAAASGQRPWRAQARHLVLRLPAPGPVDSRLKGILVRQENQLSTPGRLTTVDEVETTVGRPAPMVMLKQISALDQGCRTVLARCPIAAFGYRDADGTSRTTFIGGTPGFARVHSPTRISFSLPESGDPHGPVSLFFLLPGVGELLRVNGSVAARKGAETAVDIKEAYVHCAQAVLRSRLWQPPAPAGPATAIAGDGPLRRPGVAQFLAAAPFLALSTWDSCGGSDTSPRGDRQTAARILDGRTLVIADRKGNKRADTLHNLLQDDRLSFAALVPGRSGVLHVRGRGAITDDPTLLETLSLRGMPPHLALLIDVEHAEVTGNDAVARSRLWTPWSAPRPRHGAGPDGAGGRTPRRRRGQRRRRSTRVPAEARRGDPGDDPVAEAGDEPGLPFRAAQGRL